MYENLEGINEAKKTAVVRGTIPQVILNRTDRNSAYSYNALAVNSVNVNKRFLFILLYKQELLISHKLEQ